jgi:phosphoglucosamine mutase
LSRRYFGTDGIRGTANKHPMTPDIAMRVGMAVGLHYRNAHRQKVVIGKDTRLSSYMIENALTAGFLSVGVDVFLLGPVPTPGVAMLTRSLRAAYGVMISASHNPYDDNGIKLFGPDGYKLSDEAESAIETLIDADMTPMLAGASQLGRAKRIDGALERYIEAAKRTLPRQMSFDGFRVVIDCANGAGYKAAPIALQELGAEVLAMGVEPDGFNINRDVGSTSPEALSRKVLEYRADLGVALDGDADRVVIVDEKGRVIDGDQLMAVVAAFWSDEHRLAGTCRQRGGGDRHVEPRP